MSNALINIQSGSLLYTEPYNKKATKTLLDHVDCKVCKTLIFIVTTNY